ncbi:hypothetical protein NE237_015825 [Protea cynaroides]|uniref:Uncharacterized protein n=1 Tax=Protea cynaroides TaxID=273540 RepID=A0A9Q0KET1_9MAGN|nr:hypothetical protein NE237_015825 [Protea cynaroides]
MQKNTARPWSEGPSDPVQVVYQVRISITISSHVESMFLLVEGGTRQSVNQVLDRFSGGKSGDPLLHERSMELRISLDLEGSDHRSVRREVAGRAAEYLLEGRRQPMVNFLAGVAVSVKPTTDDKISGGETEHRSVDVTIAGSKADDMANRRGQPTVGSTVRDMGTVAVGNQKVSFHYPQMLRTLQVFFEGYGFENQGRAGGSDRVTPCHVPLQGCKCYCMWRRPWLKLQKMVIRYWMKLLWICGKKCSYAGICRRGYGLQVVEQLLQICSVVHDGRPTLMESRTTLVDRWTSVGDSSCAKVAGSIVAADQGVDLVAGGPCRSSIGMLVGDVENTARPRREGPSDPVQVVYQVRISITISSHVESMFLLVEGGTRQSVNQVLDRFSGGKSGEPLLHERSMELRISLNLEGSDHRSVRREVAGRAAEYLLEGRRQPMVNFLAGVAVSVKPTMDDKISGGETEHRSVDVTIAGSKADDMADRRGQPTVGSTVSDMGTVAVGNQKVSFHYPQMLRTLQVFFEGYGFENQGRAGVRREVNGRLIPIKTRACICPSIQSHHSCRQWQITLPTPSLPLWKTVGGLQPMMTLF